MKVLDVRGTPVFLDDETYETFKDEPLFVGRGCVMSSRLRVPIHRLIMDCPEGMVIDHINGNPLDNRRENLRVCTQSQNCMNRTKAVGDFTSKFKGVHWDRQKNRWRAVIYKKQKRTHVGYFSDELEAAKAYDRAAKELFGEYAKPNFR